MKLGIVLCPIDFSELAEREVDLAVEICEAFRARLILHHNVSAISPGFAKAWEWDLAHHAEEASTDEAQQRVDALLRRLPAGIHGEAVLSHGPVARVVLALAQELPADLLVLGTHGWSTEDHASVTERIIEQAPCPVLTVGDASSVRRFRLKSADNAEMPRLVVPTDFSESAGYAVAYAMEMARTLPLQVHLLHVAQGTGGEGAMDRLDQMVPADLSERVECHLRVGRTEQEIEEFVRQTEPELLVMGTHARSFWRRLFTRDVARQILHGATCPVCFVPPAKGA